MPRPLQAVLVLVQLLLVATLVGAIGALSTASSVDAVDGHLLGLLLYASLPGVSAFVLSLHVRTGGVGVWRGLVVVQVWFVLGALAELSGGAGAQGGARLAIPVAVAVLLARPESRRWFRLGAGERAVQRPFSLARMVQLRRDEAHRDRAAAHRGDAGRPLLSDRQLVPCPRQRRRRRARGSRGTR